MTKLNSLITVLVLSFSTTAIVGCASTGDEITDDADGDSTLAGKVDLWQASDAQWHFHLKSGNGSILLTSEAYTSRTGAINGLLSTLDNGVDTAQFAVVPATHGFLHQRPVPLQRLRLERPDRPLVGVVHDAGGGVQRRVRRAGRGCGPRELLAQDGG